MSFSLSLGRREARPAVVKVVMRLVYSCRMNSYRVVVLVEAGPVEKAVLSIYRRLESIAS